MKVKTYEEEFDCKTKEEIDKKIMEIHKKYPQQRSINREITVGSYHVKVTINVMEEDDKKEKPKAKKKK